MIKPENQQLWESDCREYRGRILAGQYSHWCHDWDGLPVDETCAEWPCVCAVELLNAVEKILDLTAWNRELVEIVREVAADFVADGSTCHRGLCEAAQCTRCSRILRARAVLKRLPVDAPSRSNFTQPKC